MPITHVNLKARVGQDRKNRWLKGKPLSKNLERVGYQLDNYIIMKEMPDDTHRVSE